MLQHGMLVVSQAADAQMAHVFKLCGDRCDLCEVKQEQHGCVCGMIPFGGNLPFKKADCLQKVCLSVVVCLVLPVSWYWCRHQSPS